MLTNQGTSETRHCVHLKAKKLLGQTTIVKTNWFRGVVTTNLNALNDDEKSSF